MALLPEKNDCVHRGVCKQVGDGMCLTECGHYISDRKFTSTNKQRRKISHCRHVGVSSCGGYTSSQNYCTVCGGKW